MGSVDALTSGSGALVRSYAFDPYGDYRDSDWDADLSSADRLLVLGDLVTYQGRGYTDHESLGRTGFVHMNGRVYDPRIGRFVQADPLVGRPDRAANYNKYAYVLNDALSRRDPTGFDACDIGPGSTCGSVQTIEVVRVIGDSAAARETNSGVASLSFGGAQQYHTHDATYGQDVAVQSGGVTESGLNYDAQVTVKAYRKAVGEGIDWKRVGLEIAGWSLIAFDVVNAVFFPLPDVGIIGIGMVRAARGRPGTYRPDRTLPRDKHGRPVPDTDAPHTQLGQRTSKRTGETYTQAREFDAQGRPVRDVDFTTHGRGDHVNPHQHRYDPQTGKRLGPEPLP